MITHIEPLTDFFASRRARGESLVLATIIETIGSTYRKPGAQMLIASDGQAAGLLSGGCAESDLIERAQRVLTSGRAEIATYDTRGSDDVIWGIGLGCEGAMKILLTRIDAVGGYRPFKYALECKQQHRRGAIALVVAGAEKRVGQAYLLGDAQLPNDLTDTLQTVADAGTARTTDVAGESIFVAPIDLPPRLLVLGAGADAAPVVELAGQLGWQTTVFDHRPAYAVAERFPRAHKVIQATATDLSKHVALTEIDAAVVMSHHLHTDQSYLATLASSSIRYVGLLGPANRRQRLLNELGEQAKQLVNRLAGPVGLDIGAQSPEAIALAIVAEIHAYLQRRSGSSFSGLLSGLPHDK